MGEGENLHADAGLMQEIVNRDYHGEGDGDDLREVAADGLSAGAREIQKVEFGHGLRWFGSR